MNLLFEPNLVATSSLSNFMKASDIIFSLQNKATLLKELSFEYIQPDICEGVTISIPPLKFFFLLRNLSNFIFIFEEIKSNSKWETNYKFEN